LLQLDNSQGDSKHEDSADHQSCNSIAGRPYSPQEGIFPQTQTGQTRNNQMIEHTMDASNSSDSSSVAEFEALQMRRYKSGSRSVVVNSGEASCPDTPANNKRSKRYQSMQP
jgi:hypothetical protein